MRQTTRRVLGVLIVLALIGGAGYYVWRSQYANRLPDGFASSNGRIEATEIDVATKIAGRVEEILVDVLTMLPATQFSGKLDPVSSLEGAGAFIGQIFPTTHYLTMSRGVFSKALGFFDLQMSFVPLVIAIPVLLGVSAALLRKQET